MGTKHHYPDLNIVIHRPAQDAVDRPPTFSVTASRSGQPTLEASFSTTQTSVVQALKKVRALLTQK